jgi:hypothetical protein
MPAFYEPALWITQSFFSGIQTCTTGCKSGSLSFICHSKITFKR